jgi:heme/copper-type cytochrome/quinol oxidase subunit 3
MQRQVLRLFQRFTALIPLEAQTLRHLSSNSIISESSCLFRGFEGKKHEQGFGNFSAAKMPSMSFASNMMHTVSTDEDVNKQPELSPREAVPVPKVPTALVTLPVKSKHLPSVAQRAMATAAHDSDDAHHSPYWVAHPFHVLPPSPWPVLAGFGAGVSCLGMASFFHAIPGGTPLMMAGMMSIAATAIAWWRDCIIESDMGMHTEVVKQNLMSGVWLFILSEAVLFFGLLWSCVHLGMQPNVNIQMQWPPVGIEAVGWDKRALVMSAVLAGSYYSANVAMVAKDQRTVMGALAATLGLGLLFLGDQYLEYSTAPFNMTDGPYGTTFYITTGFHGMHVLLGTCWLAACMAMYPRYGSPGVGMRGGILYWHFVDIVWIAVYGIIYVAQL